MRANIRESDFVRMMSLMQSRLRGYIWSMIFERTINVIFLNTILAFILKYVLDGAVQGDTSLMARGLILASSAFLVGMPITSVFYYIINRYARKAMTDIRLRLFKHINDLSVNTFEQYHTGDLVSRMTNDLETIESIYLEHIKNLALAIIIGLVSMISIFILDWRLGFAVLLLGIITLLVNTMFTKPLRRISDLIQEHWGASTERLIDLLQGLAEIKMFHIETVIHQKYTQKNSEMAIATIKYGRLEGFFDMSNYTLGHLRTLGLLVLGLFMLLRGQAIEVGTIAAVIYLQGNANYMFINIADFIKGIQRSLAGTSRVFELLSDSTESEQNLVSTSHQTSVTEDTNAAIQIRNVTFGYEMNGSAGTVVLHNINLSAAREQMTALVGPSGGGKSSIINLLLGFYSPNQGDIIINGKAIEQYSLKNLRSQIAYVPQDVYLFKGTIEENIRYGKLEATEDEIISVAKAANAHRFILEQPNGYDTQVGERGAKLSGGERQRIAIARALLKDAPILLLDEATASLDSESEQLVKEALDILMRGRTTIVIAHHLSTIEHADVIYVIDKGRVVDRGIHHELIAREGLYRRLCKSQFREDKIYSIHPDTKLVCCFGGTQTGAWRD